MCHIFEKHGLKDIKYDILMWHGGHGHGGSPAKYNSMWIWFKVHSHLADLSRTPLVLLRFGALLQCCYILTCYKGIPWPVYARTNFCKVLQESGFRTILLSLQDPIPMGAIFQLGINLLSVYLAWISGCWLITQCICLILWSRPESIKSNHTPQSRTISADYGYFVRIDFRDFFRIEPASNEGNCDYDYLEVPCSI